MKRYIIAILLSVSVFGYCVASVQAITPIGSDVCSGSAASSPVCQDARKSQTLDDNSIYGKNGILLKVTNLLSVITGVAAVVSIAVGGFKYILASGDPSNVTAAKNMIIFSLVGLIVVVLARSIIVFILNQIK